MNYKHMEPELPTLDDYILLERECIKKKIDELIDKNSGSRDEWHKGYEDGLETLRALI